MEPASDWTTGPGKWAVVAILGGATLLALGYSLGRGTTLWRSEPSSAVPRVSAPATLLSGPVGEDRADAAEQEPPASPGRTFPAPSITAKININTGTQAELELLPGVGPALAARIIEERNKGGAFRRVEDLGRVRGIGPKTIERLRAHVSVE